MGLQENHHKILCPETCIVFVTFGRPKIAYQSYLSLEAALEENRTNIKIIISDASNDLEKTAWFYDTDADDLIFTPRFTSAATSRNLANALIQDKYCPKYICLVEDDINYSPAWYPKIRDITNQLYGTISPLNLIYGIFTATPFNGKKEYIKYDISSGVYAYYFGAVADQRFMPYQHYLNVLRFWDPDILGISYAQTGGQTFRNINRGFCGAIIPNNLCTQIDSERILSTWGSGKRNPGPPAHSFDIEQYRPIQEAVTGTPFPENESQIVSGKRNDYVLKIVQKIINRLFRKK
jgi:hypothetical protein